MTVPDKEPPVYIWLLWLIRRLRRLKRRGVAAIGKDNLEGISQVLKHLAEWVKNISGIQLVVPLIALASAPAHFASKRHSWKAGKADLLPTPLGLLLGAAGTCTWLLALLGFHATWVKALGVLLVLSLLSPIWLLVITVVVLLMALMFKVVFRTDWMLRKVFLDDLDIFLVLLSPSAWRRVDWPRFYYYLCYFWVYAAVVLALASSMLLLLWFFPIVFVLALMRLSPRIRDTYLDMSKEQKEHYIGGALETWQGSRILWLLLLILFLRPTIRFFIRPFGILFYNCLRIPIEVSFKAQFRELTEKAAELFWPDPDGKTRDELREDLRHLTARALGTLRRQERRAQELGLVNQYLKERSLYSLGFMDIRQYLDPDRDGRVLREIDSLMAGESLLRNTTFP